MNEDYSYLEAMEEAHEIKVLDEAAQFIDYKGIEEFLKRLRLQNPVQELIVYRIVRDLENKKHDGGKI